MQITCEVIYLSKGRYYYGLNKMTDMIILFTNFIFLSSFNNVLKVDGVPNGQRLLDSTSYVEEICARII